MEAMPSLTSWLADFERDGYTILPDVFTDEAIAEMMLSLEAVFAERAGMEASIRGDEGTIYAARNVLELWPNAANIWRIALLLECLGAVLGPRFGLVRILFFDKPPRQTWALPWHKDLTIAVRDNRLPSRHFHHPTRKAGVPHVEASLSVLQSMLTARMHLDDVTEENGPLKVVPGSHRSGKALALDLASPVRILANRGDVLLMHPLLAHCSGKSHPETTRHRRILHLEFAASPDLPDGYSWHAFIPGIAP